MRHGRRALLLLAKRLEHLPDLAALKVANLCGDALQRARDRRQRGHEGRVHVARDHLRRDDVWTQAERLAYVLLDPRVDGGVSAHRAADAPDGDLLGRALEARARAVQ